MYSLPCNNKLELPFAKQKSVIETVQEVTSCRQDSSIGLDGWISIHSCNYILSCQQNTTKTLKIPTMVILKHQLLDLQRYEKSSKAQSNGTHRKALQYSQKQQRTLSAQKNKYMNKMWILGHSEAPFSNWTGSITDSSSHATAKLASAAVSQQDSSGNLKIGCIDPCVGSR